MAVSIDWWAPGAPGLESRRRVPADRGSDANRESRDSRAFRGRSVRADRSQRRLAPHLTPAQELQFGADRCRDWRHYHSGPTTQSSQLRASRFNASRALGVWLVCGLVLTLTCPPIAAAQTWFGALPLWLVGLPSASLAVVALGNAGR